MVMQNEIAKGSPFYMIATLKAFWDKARRTGFGVLFAALFLLFSPVAHAEDFLELVIEEQQGFGRLIFNFADRMDLPAHTVKAENNVLSLEFEEPVIVQIPDVAETLPDYLTVARLDPDARGLRMGLLTDFRVNTMIAGEKLFVDLLPANWQGLPPGLPADVVAELSRRAVDAAEAAERQRIIALAREQQPESTLSVGYNPTFIRIAVEWTAATTSRFIQDGNFATLKFAWPGEIDTYALTQNLPPEIFSVETSSEDDSTSIEFEFAPLVTARFFRESGTRFFLDIDRLEPESRSPTAEDLLQAAIDEQERLRIESEEDLANDLLDGPVPVPETTQETLLPEVADLGEAVRISFPFEVDTPASVFKRGNYLWAVFDSSAAILEPENMAGLDGVASQFSAISAGNTQIVRMQVAAERLVSLGSQGAGWVLTLGELSAAPNEPIELNRRENVDGRHELAANLGDPARVHDIRDPEVGDILRVVTMYPPARGVYRDLNFVDFDVLGSVHGFVLRPKSEDLEVTLSRHEATLTSAKGLSLSPLLTTRSRLTLQSGVTLSLTAGLMEYVDTNPGRLNLNLIELQNQAATSDGREREQARFDLANSYLANGFAEEALGVLNIIIAEGTVDDYVNASYLVKGGALVTARRYDEALEVLSEDRLVNHPDAIMWRTIARTKLEDFSGAHADALATESVVEVYPEWVQIDFLIAGVTAAIEERDLQLAQRFSTKLAQLNLGRDSFSRFELLQGRIDELEQRFDEALDTYGKVILADVRPTRAEAVYRTIDLLNRIGRIDLDRATDVLLTETITWRGGLLEAKMLGLLANLQFENGDFRGAFSTVREAAEAHVDDEEIQVLAAQAQQVFADLFLNGGADRLDPVEALTLFYTYRHLTPAGTRGDEMIRNLARRLVSVDLLEQAAGLLEYQIDNRLAGAARAQIAADLAIIHIADRAPELAMAALTRTAISNLAPSLERQRRILEARALIDAGRSQLALDILKNLDGRDAEILRIEANWKDRRFREAAEQIEFIYSRDGVPANLAQTGRRQILRAAVGFVLANDRIGLARIRNKFTPLLENSPEWPMFDYVTGLVTQNSVDFRQLASEVASTDTLSAFLDSYRRTYEGQGSLAPANPTQQI